MTGDTHRDDDLEFDDDFVLEDMADGLDDLFDDVEASRPTEGRPRRPGEQGEEDVLFQATSPGNIMFEGGAGFDEEDPSGWAGHPLDPEEIGLPVGAEPEEETTAFSDRDPLAADSDDFVLDADEELELIRDDSELERADDDETFVLEEAEAGWDQEPLETAAAGVGTPAGLPDDWAPVDHGFSLQEEAAAAPAVAEQWHESEEYAGQQPEYAELAEDYYDDRYAGVGGEVEPVVRGPRRSRRVLRFFAGLAAAALILGAGTVVVLEPELLGFKVEPKLIDRVQIARPVLDLRVAPPELPEPVAPDPTQVVTPDPTPVVAPDPTPVVTPDPTPVVTPDPVVPPDPTPVVAPDPVPDPTLVAITDPKPGTEGLPGTHVPIGDTLSIGAYVPEVGGSVLPDIGIVPGSNAFAQLKNGNFFVGNVKSVAAEAVTLRVTNGEITFALEDLAKIAPLASAEYAELARAQNGFVRLTNNNRLVGSILEGVADDHIILEMKSNRVLLPRSAIEEIGSTKGVDIRFANEESDEDWVRRLVEEQMNDPANFQRQAEKKKGVRVRVEEEK